jgi:hypothetical protein
MSRADGQILGVTKIVDSGSSANRWDLVILGDGYQEHEIVTYEREVDRVAAAMLSTPPFDQLRAAINVHRVTVVSRESGASDLCRDTRRATFFDSAFCYDRIERLLVTDTRTALEVALDAVPEMNATLMVVNTSTYGGSGGIVSVFSTAPEAVEIALHEMGHSHFGLADEYPSLRDCHEEGHGQYAGAEPGEPNVSTHPDARKWANLVTPGVALPTTRNPDCSDCDHQPSPIREGTVGAFEGARYYRCGMFRPSYDCRMRTLGPPFCAICQATIRRVLAPFLPTRRRAVGR